MTDDIARLVAAIIAFECDTRRRARHRGAVVLSPRDLADGYTRLSPQQIGRLIRKQRAEISAALNPAGISLAYAAAGRTCKITLERIAA